MDLKNQMTADKSESRLLIRLNMTTSRESIEFAERTDNWIDQNLKEHFKKLESTGYTWEEAPQNLKNAAVKLASGLNIAPVEAYKLLLEKITEQDLKDAIAGDN